MKKHTVIEEQSLIDLALMYYGNIDGVFDILKINENLNLDVPAIPGTITYVQLDENNDFARYFDKNKTEISTGTVLEPDFNFDFNLDFNS